MSMEGRMTICNMSIEWGAKAGMVAPDDTTFSYVEGRAHAPKGEAWKHALDYWRSLTDADTFRPHDHHRCVAGAPGRGVPIPAWSRTSPVVSGPRRRRSVDARGALERALHYMGLEPGESLQGLKVDRVFLGSCTNARLEDLRAAASVIRGRKVAQGVRALVVPGSQRVKSAAEAEGLDKVFIRAGFEWRNSGCSMCLGMNDDVLGSGERCASTSNRNFEGRQGKGGRTHLMSPVMAAAAAIEGRLVDVRELVAAGDRLGERTTVSAGR